MRKSRPSNELIIVEIIIPGFLRTFFVTIPADRKPKNYVIPTKSIL